MNDYQLLMVTANSEKAVFKYYDQLHTEPVKKNAEGLMCHAILDNIIMLPKEFQQRKPGNQYLTLKKTP